MFYSARSWIDILKSRPPHTTGTLHVNAGVSFVTQISVRSYMRKYPHIGIQMLLALRLHNNSANVAPSLSCVVKKTGFLHMRKQRHRSASRLHRKADHAFVFATRIIQFLYFLNPKFQASSHLLLLYSLVCVGQGWKPRRPVFS